MFSRQFIIWTSLFFITTWSVSHVSCQCPDKSLIEPCTCRAEQSPLSSSITCDHLQGGSAELERIFSQTFPVNELKRLILSNFFLGDKGLPPGILGGKSFESILLYNISGINGTDFGESLSSCQKSLRSLAIDSSPLKTISLRGMSIMRNLISLDITDSVDLVEDIPPLANLQVLHLHGNRFTSPPELPAMPRLHSLWINSGQLTSIKPLNVNKLPALKKLILFGNRIQRLEEDELKFYSPLIEYVDLSDNPLSQVHQSAIRGIQFLLKCRSRLFKILIINLMIYTLSNEKSGRQTNNRHVRTKLSAGISLETVINMSRTNITLLPESTFRPLLETLVRGSNSFLQLEGMYFHHHQCTTYCPNNIISQNYVHNRQCIAV